MNAVLVIAGPLGHPVALSRGAGEGMVVVLFGLRGDGGVCWARIFERGATCGAQQSGHDRNVDGELVERAVDAWLALTVAAHVISTARTTRHWSSRRFQG